MDDPELGGEDLTASLRKRLNQVTVANDVMTNDVLQATGSTLDTDGLQIEALLTGLREVGVITDRQEVTIQLAWAERHNEMLRTAIKQIKEQQARHTLMAGRKPKPQGLILPPGMPRG